MDALENYWDSDDFDEDDCQSIVIDNAGGMMKAGFSGDEAPRAVFPTIVSRPKQYDPMGVMAVRDAYVGDEAQYRRGRFSTYYPIKNGIINDWQNMV